MKLSMRYLLLFAGAIFVGVYLHEMHIRTHNNNLGAPLFARPRQRSHYATLAAARRVGSTNFGN